MMLGDDWYSLGLTSIEREVERMIRSFFSEFRESLALQRGQPYPLVDIHETKDKIRIMVELSGLTEQDIELHVSSDIVIIEGEKKEVEVEGERRRYVCVERESGRFRRVIEIPGAVDTGKIEAWMYEGLLYIELPKLVDRRVRRRKIPIRTQE